jgi:trigger factor
VSNVETKLLENRQATLTVEVDQERVDSALRKAARKIARQVNIPGFRKGKAPYHIIVQTYGEGALYDEALDELGQEVYKEALDETELEPYAPGLLDDIQLDPMVLTFTVPLRPEVELGNYRKVRVKREKVKVTKDEVNDSLEAIQAEQAVLEPVERGIEHGDVGSFNLKGTIALEDDLEAEPTTLVDRQDAPILIDEDTTYPLPGFPEQVLGMEAGEERTFTLVTPEDFSDDELLVGKDVVFEVACTEVKRRELPELDDEFAQSLGDYETLKALRAKVEEDLLSHKQLHADQEYADEALKAIMERATLNYPPIMIDEWIDGMVSNFEDNLKRSQNLTLEEYYSVTDTDEEALREQFKDDAEDSLRSALTMGTLAEEERLVVEDAEVDDEIETMLLSLGQQPALARHFFQGEDTKSEIRNSLLVKKVRERLIAIASGEAPPLEDIVEEPESQAESSD